MDANRIQAVPVVRAADGEWRHPDLPSFDEGDGAKCQAWLVDQGIEVLRVWMEYDADDLHERYSDGEAEALIEWRPSTPAGNGWFLLAIGDTEDDGPVAYFARPMAYAGVPK